MKFAEYIKKVMRVHSFNPKLRVGQVFMNVLTDDYPETADMIRGHVNTDPFYCDENLNNFLEWLVIEWRA